MYGAPARSPADPLRFPGSSLNIVFPVDSAASSGRRAPRSPAPASVCTSTPSPGASTPRLPPCARSGGFRCWSRPRASARPQASFAPRGPRLGDGLRPRRRPPSAALAAFVSRCCIRLKRQLFLDSEAMTRLAAGRLFRLPAINSLQKDVFLSAQPCNCLHYSLHVSAASFCFPFTSLRRRVDTESDSGTVKLTVHLPWRGEASAGPAPAPRTRLPRALTPPAPEHPRGPVPLRLASAGRHMCPVHAMHAPRTRADPRRPRLKPDLVTPPCGLRSRWRRGHSLGTGHRVRASSPGSRPRL